MSRIVSVWLPRWPIKRFLAAQAIGLTNNLANGSLTSPSILSAPSSLPLPAPAARASPP